MKVSRSLKSRVILETLAGDLPGEGDGVNAETQQRVDEAVEAAEEAFRRRVPPG